MQLSRPNYLRTFASCRRITWRSLSRDKVGNPIGGSSPSWRYSASARPAWKQKAARTCMTSSHRVCKFHIPTRTHPRAHPVSVVLLTPFVVPTKGHQSQLAALRQTLPVEQPPPQQLCVTAHPQWQHPQSLSHVLADSHSSVSSFAFVPLRQRPLDLLLDALQPQPAAPVSDETAQVHSHQLAALTHQTEAGHSRSLSHRDNNIPSRGLNIVVSFRVSGTCPRNSRAAVLTRHLAAICQV